MENNWSEICKQIMQAIPSSEYKVWIAPIKARISYNDTKVCLSLLFASSYALNRVKKHYLSLIEQCSLSVFKKEIAVEFIEDSTTLGVKKLENISDAAQNFSDTAQNSAPLFTELQATTNSNTNLIESLPTAPSILASNGQLPLQIAPAHSPNIQQKTKKFKHSFETFVVGPCNNLAYAAAQNILQPDSDVDMLFLSSHPGLGKTHLSQALGRAMYANSHLHNSSMAYLTADEFASQFIQAARAQDVYNFKRRFTHLDLLLLEDVHFLSKKGKTQEELLNIVKALQDNGGRVVFTSSLAPDEIQDVDSQLISRFRSGFVATLQYPDFDTKKSMLMHKASLKNFKLPEKVADLFAEQLHGDVRLLESSLNNLFLQAKSMNVPITTELAYSVIAHIAPQNPDKNLEEILKLTCSCFDLSAQQLASRTKKTDYVMARNTAFYLMRKHSSLTLQEIGTHLGKKHSTVSKAITYVESEISRKSNLGMKLLHSINAIEARATFIK